MRTAIGLCLGVLLVALPPVQAAPAEATVFRVGDHVEYGVTLLRDGHEAKLRLAADVRAAATTLDRDMRTHPVLELVQAIPGMTLQGGRAELLRIDHVSLANGYVVRQDRAGAATLGVETQLVTTAGFLPGDHPFWMPGPHPWFARAAPTLACDVGDLHVEPGAPVVADGRLAGDQAVQQTRTTTWEGSLAGETVDVTTWTRDSPYPAVVERTLDLGDGQLVQVTYRRTAYLAGTVPIAWPGPSCGAGAPLLPQDSEIPRDGSSATAGYPFEQALAAIEDDPTLVGFSAWRALHPAARLAGFSFGPSAGLSSATAMGDEWAVFFADGAELVGVTTQQVAPTAPPSNRWSPPETGAGAWLGEAPRWVITLGDVERAWDALAEEPHRSTGTFRIVWGFGAAVQSECDEAGYCDAAQAARRPDDVARVEFGRRSSTSVTSGSDDLIDRVVVNVTTGQLESYTTSVMHSVEGGVCTHAHTREVDSSDSCHQPEGARDQPGPLLETPGFVGGGSGLPAGAWVAGTAAAALVIAALAKLVGMLGYAKIRGDDKLLHPTRRAILDVLHAEPGLDPPALQKRLGIAASTLAYHLRSLEDSAIVSAVADGRRKRLFAGPSTDVAIAMTANPTTKALLRFVRAHPGASQSDAARHLQISPQAVPRHVRRLVGAGLLEARRVGRTVRMFPAPGLRDLAFATDPGAASPSF